MGWHKDVSQRMRVVIGTSPELLVAQKVLECSLLRHTELSIELHETSGPAWRVPSSLDGYGTGMLRWLLPSGLGRHGLGIYLDAAGLVTTDIWGLWTAPYRYPASRAYCWTAYRGGEPQTAAMLVELQRAASAWQPELMADRLRLSGYKGLQRGLWMGPAPQEIEPEWCQSDDRETLQPGYVYFSSPPWLESHHPLEVPWSRELVTALSLGVLRLNDFQAALEHGWVHADYERFTPREMPKMSRRGNNNGIAPVLAEALRKRGIACQGRH